MQIQMQIQTQIQIQICTNWQATPLPGYNASWRHSKPSQPLTEEPTGYIVSTVPCRLHHFLSALYKTQSHIILELGAS